LASANFITEMNRKRDSRPLIKLEFIDKDSNVTDISAYYLSGANFEFSKERAPDVLQAGNFDVVVLNTDNKFSEFDTSSLLYNEDYILARIRISLGFILPDGSTEYETQAVGYIDQITTDPNEATATFRCRDIMRIILDATLRLRPSSEVPVSGSNTGNGLMSSVETLPFATVSEDWTLTCTTAGGDGTGEFSVVGSVSGNIGTATSGTEFSSTTYGIKFTISGGSINWDLGDSFTFSTIQAPEWDGVNAVKIIWSVLTGYDYDTNTQEDFADQMLSFDNTKSSANTDIDYDSFVTAITAIDYYEEVYQLKGFCPYDQSAQEFIEGIILLFLGSLYTGADGRIKIQTFAPTFGGTTSVYSFSDSSKISSLGYSKTIDEVINSSVVRYKNTDNWSFSGTSQTLDGVATFSDSTSIGKYGELNFEISTDWYVANGLHIKAVGSRLVDRYADPPLNVSFQTGLDGMLVDVGDYIDVTDTKYNLSSLTGEVVQVSRNFDAEPKTIGLRLRQDNDTNILWGFLGSNADEGDGESPQASNWDSATDDDKRFIYLSQTGGGGPAYRMF